MDSLASPIRIRKTLQFCRSHRKQHTHALSAAVDDAAGGGRKREELEMWEEERDAGETSGVAGDRSDRVSWELAKRFVPPRGPYQPNWFVIPFHRRATPGLRAAEEDAPAEHCADREKAHLPPSRQGNYRI
jgi:hypothetical protein